MDQVHVIRHKVLVDGVSVRRVAREFGVSRNTVRKYLDPEARIAERAPVKRSRPTLDRVGPRLQTLLGESPQWTGGKQRLTAARLHLMLRAEGHTVGATLVKEFMREWKRQRQEVFVPLVYRPGDLAEVDFFEVLVDVAGKRMKAWMFLMRLMHSGRDFAWLYPRQDQVAFFDGHVRAFAHFGAVSQRLLYDNLRSAVARVLVGSERELQPRFEALATHYVFEACFARPRTGHDKGGVEGRGKGIRWQHLVPIPKGPDHETISRALLERLDAQAGERRDAEGRTVLERFGEELPRMLPLPPRPFHAAATRFVGASRRSLVRVEGATYSVPEAWAGLDVTAHVGVDKVEIIGPDGRVVHGRQRFGGRAIDYRHYLQTLSRKPQAVRQVAAELVRDLGPPFDAAWRRLVDEHGPKQGARAFARILDAVVTLGEREVARRLESALGTGESILLALAPVPTPTATVPADCIPASLRDLEVATASAADYDALLGGAS